MLELRGEVLSLSGELEGAGLLEARSKLESQIEAHAGKNLVLDLSSLQSSDSQILSLLLCALRAGQRHQCDVQISGMQCGLYDMARVGGLESLLPISQNS